MAELNELLADTALWSPAAKAAASARFDPKVVDIFYRQLSPEAFDFFAVRESAIPLPGIEADYRRVLFVGTTGSGKTTLVRQLLGTDPRTERFPSTSTAKTTVADMEVVISEGSFRAVVTFMPRDQVRDYVEDCLSAAVLAAYLNAPETEIGRRLLNHIDQRFRLSYMLGTGGGARTDDVNDVDSDGDIELDFDSADEDAGIPINLEGTNEVLGRAIVAARELAQRHGENLREALGPKDADETRVMDEIFEDNLEHLLRDDDQYFEIADQLMEEIERRFDFLSPGEVVRTTQGWPKLWTWETTDRGAFLRAVSRFSSNYAAHFGMLLTPIVNGVRVAGPFGPTWVQARPKLVLLDGEGLGHTPDSASSLPTTLTTRFDQVDAIVLVDNGAQPMQAAPAAVMRSVAAVGQASKLMFCFTHFDHVIGDNLPTFSAKEQHIRASAENALRTLGEQLGPWAERALRARLEHAAFFLGGIQETLSAASKRGGRSIDQLRALLDMVAQVVEPTASGDAVAVYDKTDLVLAVQAAAGNFNDGWRARLGKSIKPGVVKEHWTRIKALARKISEGWSDEYDNLKPVADLHLMLQQELYKAIQRPRSWKGRPPTDDEKQALFDLFVNSLSREIKTIAARRIRTEPMALWQEAYSQAGRGSSFVRAAIISDRIYTPAAPVAQVPDRAEFLKEILDVVEKAAGTSFAELS